jgi:Uma2 family endonuclease
MLNQVEFPQAMLLLECLWSVLQRRFADGQYFVGQDVGIYWRLTDPPLRGAAAPDWCLVLNVPPMLDGQPRRSYVMWQELQPPLIVIEFLSEEDGGERDRTPNEGKFWIYEQRIGPAYYAIYEPRARQVELYELVRNHFQPIAANERGHFAVPELGVELGIWQGTYRNARLPWLRWFDAEGRLLPTGEEQLAEERQRADQAAREAAEERQRAEQERQRAEQATREAEQEHQRTERLRERLRALGVNPDEV